ncbi:MULTISPECIES: ATP-binding protein [Caloramator]|uniref:Histidine kinase-, DNA gyrase B-, and HSP90-like ATPase n=1 Tax=Caloramator proteoclasticus DSM 10124 TaxID=1121262 RepID=A0A1M5AJY7_9CLOT|nr:MULTISPECIES: ATP-binding protein [Caloramator]SHF30454.1 Histidine kinase-, DNA gyrase B-, and HSP90-like ATPase [Caloramator proteoclasticus DSM 10124]
MRELSLHIMDIIENSISADATLIELFIEENTLKNTFTIKIKDNGKGIDEEMLKNITDPFVTSRTTRRVGLGLSLFESTCLRCNGSLKVYSKVNVGTEVVATMEHENIDRPPLGKIEETVVTVLLNPSIDLVYEHIYNDKKFVLDSREIKRILGSDEINTPEVLLWIKDFIKENLKEISGGAF